MATLEKDGVPASPPYQEKPCPLGFSCAVSKQFDAGRQKGSDLVSSMDNVDRVRTAQGKPGKPGKRDFFEKNQGKPGKLREFSDHFYNLREFYSARHL